MIEFLKSFEGIIGTIIGVFLGSIITLISKRSARINCYINSVNIDYRKVESGILREISKDEIPEYGSIYIDLEFYN